MNCRETNIPDGVTTLTYWRTLTGAAGDAQDELAARFNASRDDVRVTPVFQGSYSDLAAKLIAGSVARSGPEVTQLGTFEIRQFARGGLLLDLTPFVEGPDGLDTSDWPRAMLDAGRIDGGLYWLPFNVTTPVLYYNTDALAAAGLPGPPETWDDFFNYARRLTARDERGRVTRVGTALWNITWPILSAIWSEGGELTTRDYSSITLDAPAAASVLRRFQDLVREGAASVPDAASGGHRGAFIGGRAAMILDSPAPLAEIMGGAVGFTPGVALYPSGKAGRVFAPGGGGIAMLASTPEGKREAAWQFMKFLLQPEQLAYYAERSGYIAFTESARRLMPGTEDPIRETIHEGIAYLRGDFSVTMSPAVRRAFDEAFQRILINLEDVERVLREADAKAEREIVGEL